MSRIRGLLSRVLLALAATLVALVLLELAARVGGVDLNPNPRWRYDERLGWTIDPAWERMDGVNRRGFRHPQAAPRAEGRRRLVILGDSFSLGGRYPYASTFPGLLDKWLDSPGPPWDVVSLAVGGWGTGQQYLALRDLALRLEPDAVILQVFPYNDLCNNNIGQAFTCSLLDLHRPYFTLEGNDLAPGALYPKRSLLRRWSRVFGWLETRLQWRWSPANTKPGLAADKPLRWQLGIQRSIRRRAGLELGSNLYSLVPEGEQPELIRDGWEVTERLFVEIDALLRSRGIPLIGLVVPYVDTFDPDWLVSMQRGRHRLIAEHGTATVERMLAGLGRPVISVRGRILDGARRPADYFYPRSSDDKHLNFFGHYSVAGWALEELRELGLTDRPPPPDPFAAPASRAAPDRSESRASGGRSADTRERPGP